MKKLHFFIVLLLLNSTFLFSQVAINADGSAAHNSAMLDVKSTSKGFLPPRMTHAELNAISNPADGLIVYCTDCGSNGTGTLSMFTAGSWYSLGANCINPLPPAIGIHVASSTQIVWNWNAVTGATGYKWNTANEYSTATDLGTVTAKTETGLTCNTAYTRYVWAYSACGNSISLALSQTASACAGTPTVSTTAVSAITQTTATSGGNVTADGGATVTARGVCWSTTANPTTSNTKTTDGTGTGSITSSISGLTAGTTYYVRAYATNSAGTAYGNEVSFSTSIVIIPPTVTTTTATSITATTATSGGNTTADGGAAVTARGICWSTTSNPTIANTKTADGTGTGSFTSSITGLTEGTAYYVRAYATNSAGTGYGNEISFTTTTANAIIFNPNLTYGTQSDVEGNVYKTIQIGTQVWFAENLKTTKFKDGADIPLGPVDNTAWNALSTPGYCWYNFDATLKSTYGALYNWYTVNTAKLCPTGWHVPSDTEWTILTTFLGGESIAGGKLKETGFNHWPSPNTGATNETGFTAVPGGQRYGPATFSNMGHYGNWWSSTETSATNAWGRYMYYNSSSVVNYSYGKQGGFSVRCLQGSPSVVPTVSTTAVSAIAQTTATSGANVTADGGAEVTARGVCWSTTANPTTANSKTADGTGTGSVTSSITGLTAGTTYYVRAYATNSAGTAYGSEVNFTTTYNTYTVALASNPVAGGITAGGGTFNSGASVTVTAAANAGYTFTNWTESGTAVSTTAGYTFIISGNRTLVANYTAIPATQYAVTLSSNPLLGGTTIGGGSFNSGTSVTVTALANAGYTFTNWTESGTAVSTTAGYTFTINGNRTLIANYTTTPGDIVTDADGNVYATVTIGTQVWMAENLKTTKYRNGDAIPNVTDNTAWSFLTTGAYCNYNNDAANAAIYGKLYNWFAATDTRNIAPTGWHVPTDAEWTTLTTFLGGESVAGGKMKETGTAHWYSASTGVSNESGFTALPGGGRDFNGSFPPSNDLYYRGNWWSTTRYNPNTPAVYFRMIENASNFAMRGFYNGATGFSIRCVKD